MKAVAIKDVLKELSFFDGMSEEMLEFIAGCGQNMHFAPNEYLGKENEPVNYLYVIKKGQISLEVNHPIKGPMMIRTLHEGEMAGFNWIIPPYRFQFNLKALVHTAVVALDGNCIRNKCEEDHHLGYLLMKRSATVMNKRLTDTRLQLLDVYSERI
jgi:signal-transduction protein with cAMP-binding, CBS, and nucleotidyltransferase domain